MALTHARSNRYGLPLTTASSWAALAYEEAVDRILALDAGAERYLDQALDADGGGRGEPDGDVHGEIPSSVPLGGPVARSSRKLANAEVATKRRTAATRMRMREL